MTYRIPETATDPLAKISDAARAAGWRGRDPYDALASAWGGVAVAAGPPVRYALTQAALRVPWLRGVVAAPPLLNPKALALFLGSVSRGGDSLAPSVRERDARDLISLLDSTRNEEGGWGYPFPWQSRYFWVPAGSMNAVVTATVGWMAFDAADRLSTSAARAIALHACDQIANRLHRTKVGSGVALSYTPGDRTRVVNISALCARVLARGESVNPDHGSLAGSLAAFVQETQRPDGSWPYALDRGAEWEDSFHTGYVLEALLDVDRYGGPASEDSLERGFAAYRRFFDDDGGARLRAGAASPYDAHSAAQGILTYSALATSRFDGLAERERAGERAERIASWALSRLWLGDEGHFAYRIVGGRPDRRNFLRWVQAWMALALATLSGGAAAESASPGDSAQERRVVTA